MVKFVENVNTYLSKMKIKQSYVCLKAGMETSKLSRILTGVQDISATDMEKISIALGQKMEYFLKEDFKIEGNDNFGTSELAFYMGAPSAKQQEFATQLIDLIENVDEVLGAKNRFMKAIME